MPEHLIVNPHLDGNPFFWSAGPIGILLCHGFTATTAEVRPLGKILNEHGFTISAPLLPGHNSHPRELNRVKWQHWADNVKSYYQYLESRCDTIFVGGESTGALLALHLAINQPRITGILAYAPVLKLNMSLYNRILLSLLSPLIPYIPKSNPNSNNLWKGYSVNPLRGVLQLLKLQKVVSIGLHRITQPVLIVQGKLDTTVHPKVPEMIKGKVNSFHVKIHWMQKSAHTVILDQELDQVAHLTLDFINESLGI